MSDYVIKKGDTLCKIAKQYGMTVQQLQELNGIKNANLIFAGKKLILPDIAQDTAFSNIPGWSIDTGNRFSRKPLDVRGIAAPHDSDKKESPKTYAPVVDEPSERSSERPSERHTHTYSTSSDESSPIVIFGKHKYRSTVRDYVKLRQHGIDPTKPNDPNANAQSVVGDEDGEVHIRCIHDYYDNDDIVDGHCEESDPTNIGYIEITDNTNGKKNKYRYMQLSREQMEAGELETGQKFSKDQFVDKDGRYFILVSVTDENGNDIMAHDHAEIFKLEYSYDQESDTYNYDLVQDVGMDGAGKSSIDYSKKA